MVKILGIFLHYAGWFLFVMVKRLSIFLHYIGWFLFVISLAFSLVRIFFGASIITSISEHVIGSFVFLCITWAIRYILCGYKDIRCWKAK